MGNHKEYDFKVISLNVRGLGDKKKRKAVFQWLKKHEYDMIYLQETHSNIDIEKEWKQEWDGVLVMSHGSSQSKGCMILFNKHLDADIKEITCDNSGRYIVLQCEVMGENYVFINVYAPNTENEQVLFIKEIETKLSQLNYTSSNQYVIGGDWNIVRDGQLDKFGGIQNLKLKAIEQQDAFMNSYELNDSWRIKYPFTKRYTWRQKKPLIQCRLDYWLISDSLFDCIESMDIIPSIHSDHSAIIVTFKHIPDERKGPGLWKLNTSLINDSVYTETLKTNIRKWKNDYECIGDSRVKWELVKYEIRKFSIKFSKEKQRNKHTEKIELETMFR